MVLLLHIVGLYLAGKPQWGYYTKTNNSKIIFPIKFLLNCYGVTFGIHYDNSQYSYDQLISYDCQGFQPYQSINGNMAVMFFAVGR